MKLTAQVKLQSTPEQYELLKATLEEANGACNWISRQAFDGGVFGQFSLHKLVYHPVREKFNLSAQMVVRAIAKVADSYKVSKKKQRGFKKYGAFPYDSRILSFDLAKRQVSIWTLDGRERILFVCGDRTWELLQGDRGEADLCFIRGEFYLFVACEVESPEPIDVDGALGVDLGLANIATDSDGNRYSGATAIGLRERRFRQPGVPVVFVDPAYTSRTCSVCGYVAKSNRKSQDSFLCGQCGHSAHADCNAAINIAGRFVNLAYAGATELPASSPF